MKRFFFFFFVCVFFLSIFSSLTSAQVDPGQPSQLKRRVLQKQIVQHQADGIQPVRGCQAF